MEIKNKTESRAHEAGDTAQSRRLKYGVSVGVLIVAVLMIAVTANWLGTQWNARLDLTKGRRYSLSPQSLAILEQVDDPLTLTMLFTENDPTLREFERNAFILARKQVEDVLREFTSRSGQIRVQRIDPTDPNSENEYQALLDQLRNTRADLITQYEEAIAAGQETAKQAIDLLQNELQTLADALNTLGDSHPTWPRLRSIYNNVATIPFVFTQLNARVDESLTAGVRRPMPDWEGAQSILAQMLDQAALNFPEIATLYRETTTGMELPEDIAQQLEASATRFQASVDPILDAKERLTDLEPINLQRIMNTLASGNCVLISNSRGVNIVPFGSLFPIPSADQADQQGTVDRRFAGERVISTAIRKLIVTDKPIVVICHAEPHDPLNPQTAGVTSLRGVSTHLGDLGFDVRSWNAATEERPDVSATNEADPVWVILPPQPSNDPRQASTGASLASAAQQLVNDGERIFALFWPSMMVGFGQPDIWASITEPLGVVPDTGRLIFQQFPNQTGRDQNTTRISFKQYATDTRIGESLDGLETNFIHAVPIRIIDAPTPAEDESIAPGTDDPFRNISRSVIASIQPSGRIWAESNFLSDPNQLNPPATPDPDPYPLVVSVERPIAAGGIQRVLIAGSVVWFDDSFITQAIQRDQSIVVMNPGNMELFVSGVCWLAGLDELIAPSAMTQTVSRIENLTSAKATILRILLMAGLPLACLGAGIVVWFFRRG